ncbi:hypothetical protein HanIR_Chr09g0399241 [Helianthus annuus]|nr:hypothetical protein HanIR_Chr09g0399241 [Helianthus annuus]
MYCKLHLYSRLCSGKCRKRVKYDEVKVSGRESEVRKLKDVKKLILESPGGLRKLTHTCTRAART